MSESPKNFRSLKLHVANWIDGQPSDWTDGPIALEDTDPSVAGRQLVIHSMLVGHFESAESREKRIQLTLDAFDRLPTTEPLREKPLNRRRWMFVATTAASLLLAFGVWGLIAPQNAEAALARVIAATQLPVTRVYEATIKRRVLGRDVDRKATLYSRSVDRFAAEFHETRLRPDVWIGFDGQQRWLEAGDYQWSSTDDVELPRDAIIDRVTLRNMQFNSLLTEIPRSFHVRLLRRETLSIDGQTYECQPIEAIPRIQGRGLPNIVRIWPHPESGVVLQMHVINNDSSPLGVRRVELQLTGEQEVPEDFFSLESHRR